MRKLALSAVLLTASLLSAPVAGAHTGAGPGCARHRHAVAYHAGGLLLKHQPAGAPIPCGMQTGFAGGESAIAVTDSGAVFYAPAVQSLAGTQAQYFLGGNSGFARTSDEGAKWTFDLPISPNLAVPANPLGRPGWPAWDQIDDKFYMDRGTGRLFWADPDLPSEAIIWTNDDGVTWGYSLLAIGFGGEWTQVTTAKPRLSKPTGYPKVVYACGEYDSLGRDFSSSFEGDVCQKSLDGGQTWTFAGQGFFGGPETSHPQCHGKQESPNFSPWAAPDPQGRLYELLFCDSKTFLIRSSDEGATWPIVARVPFKVPDAGPGQTGAAELRTDAQGNLYLGWANRGNPDPNAKYFPSQVELAVSRDGGHTWSHAMDVMAPGVKGIRTHFGFDVGAPGHVAISYLGKLRRAGFDGFITETFDALSKRPVFWSAEVNNPSQAPLDNGTQGSSGGKGLDYVSVMFGPHDVPWASFWDDCGENLPQKTPGCPKNRQGGGVTTLGFRDYAGRLAPAPAPRRSRHHRSRHHRKGSHRSRSHGRSHHRRPTRRPGKRRGFTG